MNLPGKQVLVLGLGASGLSMAHWLTRRGARVRVADSRDEPPLAARLARELPAARLDTGPFRKESFRGIDLIAISPGVALAEPQVACAIGKGVPVVGDVELFARALTERYYGAPLKPRVIAITGSNGKSTVTSLVGAMCEAAGLATVVAGNIGLPVLDALMAAEARGPQPDAYVLELSSFQLETTDSLRLDAATVLNVSEDHLDRYESIDAYAAAKARIFRHCALAVLNRDDERSRALHADRHYSFGLAAPRNQTEWGIIESGEEQWLAQGMEHLMTLVDLPITGLHNAANALAALALCRAIALPYEPLIGALKAFRGLPHRVEQIAERGGRIKFYDDSKGTNVGATVAALTGMAPRKIVLIAGGDGKGQDFTPLLPAVVARARAVVLIGRDAERIAAAIAASGVPILYAGDMADAVVKANAAAKPGDAVLLSPACASFDMFQNYVHRAEAFIAAVRGLQPDGRDAV